ncbi:phosphoserine phosphatase SerB [Vogesella indigofera]|uniref:phosphoserine phosphatase SerB n=1 Tax=Vogesella indigofera TaxID=45465 RepID=UPI00234F8A30|nr:phosphoserine phosphatase SerB [Vogesella indigofera]MDC7696176.1 phosphoserine phosphatase SerB [Vogesella indigofera]
MSTPQTLVLQAPTLDQARITELAALSGARDSRSVAANVVRLDGVDPARRELVLARAERLSVDANYVDSARRFADFGLLVSDMDSTLITIECIDEIADMQGLKPQVAAITERSMRGELDFTESLKARVALLAGLPEAALASVYDERLQLMAGARELLAACREHGVKFMLVSGGFTYFTERLKAELNLDYCHANQLEIVDGKLTGRVIGDIVDGAAKRRLLIAQREALGLRAEQVIAMGDGANDLLMLAEAGVGVATHAKPVVRAQARYTLNHVGLDGIRHLFL